VSPARLNRRQFDQFRAFIYRECGIRMNEQKVTLLSHRIGRRLKSRGLEDYDAYFEFLTSPGGASERQAFFDAITTNETYFFRTAKHFDWFKSELITELVAQHRSQQRTPSLRIWSAGCANGAEPFSLSMCLIENRFRLRDWSVAILGSDISHEALAAAQEAKFRPRAIKAVSDSQRRRFLRHLEKENLWQVRDEVRELVAFKKHNLLNAIGEEPFDCIFIRNVLIYFDRESKQIAINHLLNALTVGGYLVVGPSEGIYNMLQPLKKVSAFLYQKVAPTRPHRRNPARETRDNV
jgi:chemotaxis protein methyltransferase CheR